MRQHKSLCRARGSCCWLWLLLCPNLCLGDGQPGAGTACPGFPGAGQLGRAETVTLCLLTTQLWEEAGALEVNSLLSQLSPAVNTGTCHPQGGENLHQAFILLPAGAIPWLWVPPGRSGLLLTFLCLHTCTQSSNRALCGFADLLGLTFPEWLFARCRNTDVHTVASLFKLYLRELPEPVVPWLQYEDFLRCGQALEADETKVEMVLFSVSVPGQFVSWGCRAHSSVRH